MGPSHATLSDSDETPGEAPGMELRVSRVQLAAELRTAPRTLRRGLWIARPPRVSPRPAAESPVPAFKNTYGSAFSRWCGAAARSMDVGRTGEYHRENRVFPVIGHSYRPTTKIGGAVRKCGKHHYAICKLHGSEMCGREINEFATDLISKILISRGQVKIEKRHEPPPTRPK